MPVRPRPPAPVFFVYFSPHAPGAFMHIAELRIKNFRGIQSAHVRFAPHTVFIGPNNSGKTTLIESLALLFGRDRLIRELTEHDFFGSNPTAADRICIIVTITGFRDDDPNKNVNWFREDRAVSKWFNPTDGSLHAARARPEFQLACQVGLAARFVRDDLAVDVIRYFHDDDDVGDVFDSEVVRRVPPQLIREIGFFLIPANRTWDRTISFGSELFRRVVSTIGGQPAAAVLAERDRLRSPSSPLEQDPGLASIVGNIEFELKGLLGKNVALRLRLTATDSEAVLDAVMPHYSVEGRHQIPAKRQGSGLVSLQHLLLLLHFGHMRAERQESFLLAMEEPELHVPPPLQRKLIHRIRALSTQTIITTHSPIVASACDPTSLTLLHNRDGVLQSSHLLGAPLPRTAPNWKRTLYIVKRQDTVTALMHDVVLVPEGRIDFDLIRLLVNADESRRDPNVQNSNQGDFGALVGHIPTHDGQVRGTFEELTKIHRRVLCLVDGDKAGLGYAKELSALPSPPARVLQWPTGWLIEDVIGWIADVNIDVSLPLLSAVLGEKFATKADFVHLLKTPPPEGGVKGDLVAYEIVIETLSDDPLCLDRVRLLLRRMSEACLGDGANPAGWTRAAESTAKAEILRFVQ
jgi:putative ATP-dependent endonuclease of the OLD family